MNLYYQKNSECPKQEGLEEYKGPQTYQERTNKELLHYYGKGWYKWYKKSEFLRQMLLYIGEEKFAIAKLELFGAEHFTPLLTPTTFQYLLKLTHEALVDHVGREKIVDKLIPYSGPQCYEDRVKKDRIEYDSDFRKRPEKPSIPQSPSLLKRATNTTKPPRSE